MPSPIAHTAVGYWIFLVCRGPQTPQSASGQYRPEWRLLLAILFLSLLPDLDTAVAILMKDFGEYHSNVTHSPFFGLAAALGIGAAVWLKHQGGFVRWLTLSLVCIELHIIMDFFTAGRGIMLLWPASSDRYTPPLPLFYGLHWSDGWLSVRHLWTFMTELASCALVALILLCFRILPPRLGR